MISKCDSCSYLEEKGANRYCSYHDTYVGWMGCEDCNPKPITNADRIRAMSDEELMLWLYAYADGSGKTREQWLEWLKEEVEDD